MKKLLLVLALLCGCDDETIRENFVPYFVCSYLPMWMGDCQDQEVIDKAQNVLEHGFTAARIECSCRFDRAGGGLSGVHDFMASKLQDGSCLTQSSGSGTYLWPRSDPRSLTCDSHKGMTEGLTIAEGGLLKYVPDSSFIFSETADIETCCTGFNLEAFGVE
jgi:hypothetical protein